MLVLKCQFIMQISLKTKENKSPLTAFSRSSVVCKILAFTSSRGPGRWHKWSLIVSAIRALFSCFCFSTREGSMFPGESRKKRKRTFVNIRQSPWNKEPLKSEKHSALWKEPSYIPFSKFLSIKLIPLQILYKNILTNDFILMNAILGKNEFLSF